MARSWPAKDPNDVLDYQIDWSRRLDTGDSIGNAAFSLAVPAGLTIVSQSFTANSATVWLSGGNAGQTAQILCRISTAGGRQMDITTRLAIAEQ